MESVTRSVALVWRPARYAVVWANEPDEVPLFDPSRGGDPFAPVFDVTVDGVRFTSRDKSLGGREPPPQLEWEEALELEDGGNAHFVSTSGPNYPRLVRSRVDDVGEVVGPVRPLEHLAALSSQLSDGGFQDAAREAAGVFGPLSYAERDFTLVVWRHTVLELGVHLALLNCLGNIAELSEDQMEGEIDSVERRRLHTIIEPLDAELALPAPNAVYAAIASSNTVIELRFKLATLYWSEFTRQLRPYAHPGAYFRKATRPTWPQKALVDVGAPGQIVVRCGSRGWSYYELWKLASEGKGIRQCLGCGRLFQPRRRDAQHCSGTCRVKSHRRRRR